MSVVLLGDGVNYMPTPDFGNRPIAAYVIGVNEDGTVDLKTFPGYAQGISDIKGVPYSATGDPGTFSSPRGPKGASRLSQPLNDSDNTTVALENEGELEVEDGDGLLIGQEYMTVTDATDPSNLVVDRAQGGSQIAAHAKGDVVKLGVEVPEEPEEAEEEAAPQK